MLIQSLLKRAVKNPSPAIEGFIEHLCPPILEYFSGLPALGGSGRPPRHIADCIPAGVAPIDAKSYKKFQALDDQSMATHLLNGIFAAFRLAEKLPDDKTLSDLEQRIWILGYIMHDYTKVFGVRVEAADIPTIRALISCLGEKLNFEAYLSGWSDYLDDVAFLAQNTQTVEGSNLNRRAFEHCQIHPRKMEAMCKLASIADILVHIKSPADVAFPGEDGRNTHDTLRRKIAILFGAEAAPKLVYHRLTEVRGLISNMINNAVMAEIQAGGCEPFLFFPNGVVYLASNSGQVSANNYSQLPERVWEKVKLTLMDKQEELNTNADDIPDFKDEGDEDQYDGKGLLIIQRHLKVKPMLYEVLSTKQLLLEGKSAALSFSSSIALDMVAGQKTPESAPKIKNLKTKEQKVEKEKIRLEYQERFNLVLDSRTDQLAEFLIFLWRRVLKANFSGFEAQLMKQQKIKAKDGYLFAKQILEWLGIENDISPDEAIFQRGSRISTGWYCAAGAYLHKDKGFDEMDTLMDNLIVKCLSWLNEHNIQPPQTSTYQDAVLDYVRHVTEINGQPLGVSDERFDREIQNYIKLKDQAKLQCTMCSSPFEGGQQMEGVVPFAGQQYSNKGKLDSGEVKRGICPICALEMVIRQMKQEMPPRDADKMKLSYLFIYPTYFFTAETARLAKDILPPLADLDFSIQKTENKSDSIIYHFREKGYSIRSLITFDAFFSDYSLPPRPRATILTPQFADDELAGLVFVSIKPPKPLKAQEVPDTDAWILPAFYAFALPLLLNIKVVATSSYIPLFTSGAEFRETTILDAPHNFLLSLFGHERFRVDETAEALMRLMRLYDLHVDVFEGKKNDFHWAQINAIVHDVLTDPLYVFSYYDRRKRADKPAKGGNKTKHVIPKEDLDRYFEIYLSLGGDETMCSIGKLVDAYAEFYRHAKYDPDPSSYVLVRPLNELIETTLRESTNDRDCLKLTLCGVMADVIDRVWDGGIKGAANPIKFQTGISVKERKQLTLEKLEAFVEIFLSELFEKECKGQRAILQERANRIRSAAKFYYTKHYFEYK